MRTFGRCKNKERTKEHDSVAAKTVRIADLTIGEGIPKICMGLAAAEFDHQLDDEVKEHRAEVIMDSQQLISEQLNEAKANRVFEAVVEGFDKYAECWFGRTQADAPDIDGKVFFTSDRQLAIGEYVNIRITDTLDYDLIGEVTE